MEWFYVAWFLFGFTFLAVATAFYFKSILGEKMKSIEESMKKMAEEIEVFNKGRSAILDSIQGIVTTQSNITDRLNRLRIGLRNDDVNSVMDPSVLSNTSKNETDELMDEIINRVEKYKEKKGRRGIDRYFD